MALRRALWVARGRPEPDQPVFVSPEGCKLDYSNLYSRIVPAMRTAGIGHGRSIVCEIRPGQS